MVKINKTHHTHITDIGLSFEEIKWLSNRIYLGKKTEKEKVFVNNFVAKKRDRNI